MTERILVPSPNWFLTTIASCSLDGTLAYGVRNGIVIINPQPKAVLDEEGPPMITMRALPNAHRDKVTTLCFSERNLPECGLDVLPLASGSDDGSVRVWNMKELSSAQYHSEHRAKVTAVDWTRIGDMLLVSADEEGRLIIWDLLAGTMRSMRLLNATRLSPQAIACSPCNQDLVAAGCKDGHVCLLSIKGPGHLLQKMRGHDKNVVSLSWCPKAENENSQLLASGGLDKKVFIWRPKTVSCVKIIDQFTKRLSSGYKARPETSQGNVVVWLPVKWLKPNLLLTGSASSELLAWNPTLDKPMPVLVHAEHLRGMACIAAQCKPDPENWRIATESCSVWTMAQDRRLIYCEISQLTDVSYKKPRGKPTVQKGVAENVSSIQIIPDKVKEIETKKTKHQDDSKTMAIAESEPTEVVETDAEASKEPKEENGMKRVGTVESPQKSSKDKETPDESPQESSEDKETPVESPQESGEDKETPVEIPQESSEVKETPVEIPQESSEEKETPVESPQESSADKETPVESPQESGEVKEAPVESPQESSEEKENPVESPQESSADKETPVESPQESSEDKETPLEIPQESSEDKKTPVEGPQEASEVKEAPVESPQEASEVKEAPVESPQELSEVKEAPVESPQEASEVKEAPVESPQELSEVKEAPVESPQQSNAIKGPFVFPTLGGFVYCFADCPFVPGRVAIGIGDDTIRIWNMNDATCLNVQLLWQRIKGKVMSLAWHPKKEGVLAFSTSDGRVGVYHVLSNKEPLIFKQAHKSTVYRVAWGPPVYMEGCDEPHQPYYLYACDEFSAVYYNYSADGSQVPVQLRLIIKSANPSMKLTAKHKELAWKPDHSMLAIGLDDGCVQLFSTPHLHCVHTLLAHKRSVFFLLWHPLSTATDSGLSPHKNWLASCSMDNTISVFDLSTLGPNEQGEWNKVALPIERFTELKSNGKVVCLSWNPHIGGQLVSSSYDKTAKVWDVAKQQVLASYERHNGCVLSCCWSQLDPDLILSGSADFSVHVWRVSRYPPHNFAATKEESEKMAVSKEDRKVLKAPMFEKRELKIQVLPRAASTDQAPRNDTAAVASVPESKSSLYGKKEHHKAQKMRKQYLFPTSGRLCYNPTAAMSCCEELLRSQGLLQPLGKPTELTNGVGKEPEATSEEGDKDTTEVPLIAKIPNLGYFSTQENFHLMLRGDEKALEHSGSYPEYQHLQLWQGKLGDALKNAVQAKTLNDWLVSISSSISHKLWLEMCSAYATQLAAEEDYLKAASYLLCCHKVVEAVDLLRSNQLFREALVLSRCRLPPDDPIIKQILVQWGHASTKLGSYELAAQCFVSAQDYEMASTVLGKRKDKQMRQLAATLAKAAGNETLCATLALECIKENLMEEEWNRASDILQQHEVLKPLKLLMEVHKLVCELSKAEPPSVEQLATVWTAGADRVQNLELSLLSRVAKIYKTYAEEKLYDNLTSFLQASSAVTPESNKELLLQLSRLLLLATAARSENSEDWERHVVEALHLAYRRGLVCVKERPLQILVWWLRCPILERLAFSETAFLASVMLDSVSIESTDTPALLMQYKPQLLDREAASYSRLGVIISDLERKVATLQASKNGAEQALASLEEARTKKQELESSRVAFPSPLIIFCKLNSFVEAFRDRELLSFEEIQEWMEELGDYRGALQK